MRKYMVLVLSTLIVAPGIMSQTVDRNIGLVQNFATTSGTVNQKTKFNITFQVNQKGLYSIVFEYQYNTDDDISYRIDNVMLKDIPNNRQVLFSYDGDEIYIYIDLFAVSYVLEPGTYTFSLDMNVNYAVNYQATFRYDGPSSSNMLTRPLPSVPSTNRNYVLSRTYTSANGKYYLDQVQYSDGLGRPVQAVQRGVSPAAGDLVSLQEYDPFGRQSDSWLPAVVPGNNGGYVDPVTVKTGAISANGGDQKPYSMPVYEASPLNRVLQRFGPGADWHDNNKAAETTPKTNSGTSGVLSCTLFTVDGNGINIRVRKNNYYADGQLYVTELKDEDGNASYEFRDKLGRVVLTRQVNSGQNHETYYVYDDFGNLCFVLPPSASEALVTNNDAVYDETNSAPIKEYAYLYKYDDRNRCIARKMPGREWNHYVYDKADRLIFAQDGEQYNKNPREWTFSIPDAFGRTVLTGICANTINYAAGPLDDTLVQAEYPQNGSGTYKGYAISGIVLAPGYKILSASYYDDYDFRGKAGIPASGTEYNPEAGFGEWYAGDYGDAAKHKNKGLLTGTLTAQMDADGTISPVYLYSVMYYDHRGRVVQTHASNHLGGFEDEYFAYTFTGKVKQHQQVHSAPGKTTLTEVYTYSYDHAERLLSVAHKLNSEPQVTLAQYTYDEVGRVKTKKLGTETSSYSYNVRSWLTQITGTKFNQTVAYNTAANGITPSKALFGGSIGAMRWKAGDETTERGYQFSYDNLDRMTNAVYGEGVSITANLNRFNETVTAYDKMGNILALQRQGKLDSGYGMMDNLTYTYTGNKLTKVTDAVSTPITSPNAFQFVDRANVANEYTYDANGNMTKDLNKNITSISYNSLNLPDVVSFTDGNSITYGYDAAGSKLSVAYKSGANVAKTEYAGNKVYRNGTLSMILTEEGYITLSGTTPTYHYFLKDHQGNNRVVINQSGTVQQVNHYYPFGGLFGEGAQTLNQPYRYNGKELDRQFGLDMYDYGARHYDAAVGRWGTPDPLAEKYYGTSPYVYCNNNPIRYIDLDGREAWEVNKQWNEDYINKFSSFISNQTNQYVKDGNKFTCEDFALSLLIDFASTNGLPVTIYNGSGTYDARSDNYTDVATFKNDVLTTTGARDLQNNNNTVSADISGARGGDIIVNRNNNDVGTHIQVVTAGFYIGNTDFVNGVSIAQGNSGLLNGVPGSSSILGAGNPNSFFYTGKSIERGWIDVNANVYFNNTKETTTSNYSNAKNIDVRRWNFSGF